MKKLIVVLLVAITMLLTACGKEENAVRQRESIKPPKETIYVENIEVETNELETIELETIEIENCSG